MKLALLATIIGLAMATPLAHHQHAKRDYVTNVVHATKVLYQNEIVYVDGQGKPYTTKVEPVSTAVNVGNSPAPSPSPSQEEQGQQQVNQVASSSAAESSSIETSSPYTPPAPSTSSTPAPEPTTSEAAPSTSEAAPSTSEAAPSPSTTSEAAPSPSSSSAAAPSSSSSSSSSGNSGSAYSGQATYYTPGLGACGSTSTDDDLICALNKSQWSETGFSNSNTVCGSKIKITRGSKSVTVTVVDMCPGCSEGDLDLSPAAFNKIADEAEGRVDINWEFVH